MRRISWIPSRLRKPDDSTALPGSKVRAPGCCLASVSGRGPRSTVHGPPPEAPCCCSTTAVTDPQQHSFLLNLESGGQSGPGLYRAGCICAGWAHRDLVRPDSPEAQLAYVSWTDEHFLPLHQV